MPTAVTRRRRHVRLAALLAVSATALVACGGGDAPAGPETGTVTALVNITPALTQELYDSLVADFEAKNPGIQVELVNTGGQPINAYYRTLVASGNVPDVVAGIDITPDNAAQFVDLSGQAWAEASPNSADRRIDGRLLASWAGLQLQSLVFYNPDLWSQAGITEPPATLAEFTDDLRALKAIGTVPLQAAGENVTGSQSLKVAYPTVLTGNPTWYADRSAGQVTFAGSGWQSAMEVYDTWRAEGLIPADALGLKGAQAQAAFLNGQAATFISGSFFAGQDNATPHAFQTRAFPMPPLVAGETSMASTIAEAWSVTDASEVDDLAMKWVEYATTDPFAATAQLQAEGAFGDRFPYQRTALGDELATILADSPLLTVCCNGAGDNWAPSGFQEEWNTQTQSLYTGSTVPDMMARMDQWWDENATTG